MMPNSIYPLAKFYVEPKYKKPYTIEVEIRRIVCFGWAGRDKERVLEHIEELTKLGVPTPKSIPEYYIVPPYLLYYGDIIEAYTKENSGEVEYVLIFDSNGTEYVAVGSDHTDRELERYNIEKSKQIYPKVVSKRVWLLNDVIDHWDNIIIRSWIEKNNKTILYQEDSLATLLRPEELTKMLEKESSLKNLIVFSGTIPTKSGEIAISNRFTIEMWDPIINRTLKHTYAIKLVKRQ